MRKSILILTICIFCSCFRSPYSQQPKDYGPIGRTTIVEGANE